MAMGIGTSLFLGGCSGDRDSSSTNPTRTKTSTQQTTEESTPKSLTDTTGQITSVSSDFAQTAGRPMLDVSYTFTDNGETSVNKPALSVEDANETVIGKNDGENVITLNRLVLPYEYSDGGEFTIKMVYEGGVVTERSVEVDGSDVDLQNLQAIVKEDGFGSKRIDTSFEIVNHGDLPANVSSITTIIKGETAKTNYSVARMVYESTTLEKKHVIHGDFEPRDYNVTVQVSLERGETLQFEESVKVTSG